MMASLPKNSQGCEEFLKILKNQKELKHRREADESWQTLQALTQLT